METKTVLTNLRITGKLERSTADGRLVELLELVDGVFSSRHVDLDKRKHVVRAVSYGTMPAEQCRIENDFVVVVASWQIRQDKSRNW